MPFPIIPALIGAGAALAGVSSAWGTYQQVRRLNENRDWWNTYERNTGYRARYQYRSGMYNDYVGAYLHGASGIAYSTSLLASNFYDPYSYKGSQKNYDPYRNGYY